MIKSSITPPPWGQTQSCGLFATSEWLARIRHRINIFEPLYCTISINWTVMSHSNLCFVKKLVHVTGHRLHCQSDPTWHQDFVRLPAHLVHFFCSSSRFYLWGHRKILFYLENLGKSNDFWYICPISHYCHGSQAPLSNRAKFSNTLNMSQHHSCVQLIEMVQY